VKISPLAGKPAEQNILVNIPRLVTAYYTGKPDPSVTAEKVSFGTSGHRGSSFKNSFNENPILSITKAICLYRKVQKTDSPSYLGELFYDRIETKATPAQKEKLKNLSSAEIKHKELAGANTDSILSKAPGNNVAIDKL